MGGQASPPLPDRGREPDNITRPLTITPKDTSSTSQPQQVPPVIRYVSSIIHKHLNILSSSPRCTKPFVAFRRSNNLSNLLVNAKLHKAATVANQPDHFKGKMVTFVEL